MRAPSKDQALKTLIDRGIPVSTILDVGILSGTPELIKAWPGIEHILFEPVEEFESQIASTYANTKHQLHKVAVGSSTGIANLEVRSVVSGVKISHSSITSKTLGATPDVRAVPLVCLDEFVPALKVPQPYLLKIDVDGCELEVVKGARQTIRDSSVVIIECPHLQLAERISVIQSLGFRLFDLAEPCYYDEAFWQCDAIFVNARYFDSSFKTISGGVEKGLYERFTI